MSARDRSAPAILATVESGAFDDVGALVVAMRHMLDDEPPLAETDRRALYVIACMAEAAWRRLDDAMTGQAT